MHMPVLIGYQQIKKSYFVSGPFCTMAAAPLPFVSDVRRRIGRFHSLAGCFGTVEVCGANCLDEVLIEVTHESSIRSVCASA